MKKGFTLIELLAVIVILAIIALIATPLILNIINESREKAQLRSAENYITAVEQAVANKNLKGEFTPDKCVSTSTSKELTCSYNDVEYTDKLKVSVNGEIPDSAELTFSLDSNDIPNGKVKKDSNLKLVYDDITVTGSSNKLTITETVSTANPVSFETDSWETIAAAFQDGSYVDVYNIGDEKEVDMGDLGTHTVRIANLSRPDACDTTGYSQTACGVVIEFVDVINNLKMNSTSTNAGGYPASSIHEYITNTIFPALPSDLQNVIIDTYTVSSHGSKKQNNFTSTEQLYLLSPTEVYGSSFTSSYDSAKTTTHQLDYYRNNNVTRSNSSLAIKKLNGTAKWWWLRSAGSDGTYGFFCVKNDGSFYIYSAGNRSSVAPVFRLNTGE